MKCPHCNQEHPDGFQFCPMTGKTIELLEACTNSNCPDYGKHILPLDSLFCPTCGHEIHKGLKSSNSSTELSSLDIYLNDYYKVVVDNDIQTYIVKLIKQGLLYIADDNERQYPVWALFFPVEELKHLLDDIEEEARRKHEIVDGVLQEGSVCNKLFRYFSKEDATTNLSNVYCDFRKVLHNTNMFPEWSIKVISNIIFRRGLDFHLRAGDYDKFFKKANDNSYYINLGSYAISLCYSVEEKLDSSYLGEYCSIKGSDGKYGVIWRPNPFLPCNTTIICPPIFDEIDKISENMIRVKDKNKQYGFIDLNLKSFIKPQFVYAERFHCQRAIVKDENGKYGYIDKSGRVVIPCIYKYARSFKDGKALVWGDDPNGNRWEYRIDVNGNNI